MNKEEFLAMSLPYGLKCVTKLGFVYKLIQIDDSEQLYFGQSEINIMDEYYPYTDGNCKPILHPLFDLTKPITHKGETFVPIEKIFELMDWDKDNLSTSINNGDVTGFYSDIDLIPLSHAIKLIEWHFDIAGLIEKGEAIDINTLDKNPYE